VTPALWVAQTIIARLTARPGKVNGALRDPTLVVPLILLARGVLSPGSGSTIAWALATVYRRRAQALSPRAHSDLWLNFTPEPTGIGKFTGEMAAWPRRARPQGAGRHIPALFIPNGASARAIRHGVGAAKSSRGSRSIVAALCFLAGPGLEPVIHLASFAICSLPMALLASARLPPPGSDRHRAGLGIGPGSAVGGWLAGTRALLHIQDFEIDAAFALGIVSGGRLRLRRWLSNPACCAAFECVSHITPAMVKRLAEEGCRRRAPSAVSQLGRHVGDPTGAECLAPGIEPAARRCGPPFTPETWAKKQEWKLWRRCRAFAGTPVHSAVGRRRRGPAASCRRDSRHGAGPLAADSAGGTLERSAQRRRHPSAAAARPMRPIWSCPPSLPSCWPAVGRWLPALVSAQPSPRRSRAAGWSCRRATDGHGRGRRRSCRR